MSPQVSSTVEEDTTSVPQTKIPRSAAAFRSIEALRTPVVTRSFSLPSRSSNALRKGVRSRMATMISKSLQSLGQGVLIAERVVKYLDGDGGTEALPVGHLQSHFLIVVENGKSRHGFHSSHKMLRTTPPSARTAAP